jgi:hypothetical protein
VISLLRIWARKLLDFRIVRRVRVEHHAKRVSMNNAGRARRAHLRSVPMHSEEDRTNSRTVRRTPVARRSSLHRFLDWIYGGES